MGIADKAENAAEGLTGKAKKVVGDKTDDSSMKAEGEKDQTTADVKKVGEDVKDAFKS